jgi:cytochrome c oxidase subunit II
MGDRFPLFPQQASTVAPITDAFYFFMVAITIVLSAGIFLAILIFAIKYRRRAENEVPPQFHGPPALELAWTLGPLFIVMLMFAWGTHVFFAVTTPPDNALQIYGVGKQWMWKFQHMEGHREINELHVPVGTPVKVTLTSEDVIHSFYVPDFRTKTDVLPGRYTTVWFQATRPGSYRLYCAEYCGTKHSGMIGWIRALEPQDYQAWLGGGAAEGSMADAGQRLFQDLGCASCHLPDGRGRGPSLVGVYGSAVKLADGRTVKADEAYIRESILNPTAKITAGFTPIMPTFQGLVTEEGISQLVEYVRSLGQAPTAPPVGGTGQTGVAGTQPEQR